MNIKKLLLQVLMIFIFSTSIAQPKGDYTWILGYNPNNPTNGYGGTIMEFTDSSLNLSYFPIPFDNGNSAQMCGENGQILFYSNGCKIGNAQHQLMNNGDGINPGELHEQWCNTGDDHDYNTHQGLIALPWPGREGQYLVFHMGWYRLPEWPRSDYLRDFYFTHVDMTAENGLGAVVDKNHLILQDTNLIDNVTAVRHGNGRDWWIVLPRGQSDVIYTFLLTPAGVQGPFEQHIGEPTSLRGFVAGQIVFSPDGTRFVRTSSTDGIDIFNFDRCKGRFSCPKRLPFPYTEFLYPSGTAISPGSRYLYVSATAEIYQYDLWANDIERSKVRIGIYDGFLGDLHQTSFYQQRLAPDNKIYMSATNSIRYLHTIHQPDSAGLACDFRQHNLKLPTSHGFCLLNFPYFRLYDAPGSPCDTLGIDAPEDYLKPWAPVESLRLIPNPASGGLVTVRFTPCSGGALKVYDVAGRELLSRTVGRESEQVFDCSHWPAGVYIVSHQPEGGCRPVSAKLVVAR